MFFFKKKLRMNDIIIFLTCRIQRSKDQIFIEACNTSHLCWLGLFGSQPRRKKNKNKNTPQYL